MDIELRISNCCGECPDYHYVIMKYNSDGNYWYNSGVCGIEKTLYEACMAGASGYREVLEREP